MYNNNGYEQQHGGYQQSQQQDDRRGSANEYYGEHQQHQQHHNQPPEQYQQHNSQYDQSESRVQGYGNGGEGHESSRGVMGALAGAAVGGFGAYKLSGSATGHKKTSGLVGALGGALTGHVLQDGVSRWKDSHDEKKKKEEGEKRHNEGSQSGYGSHHDHRDTNDRPRQGHFAGSFTDSSRDVRLEGSNKLHAQCRRTDGTYQSSTILLDNILENDNGSFRWTNGDSHSGGSSVTVESGDTLRAIAARHNCSFDELARHNGIENPDMIYPGQRLELPGVGSASAGRGNFSASARNIRLTDGGQKLEAELSRNGEWVSSSIVLDERITNRNGCLEPV